MIKLHELLYYQKDLIQNAILELLENQHLYQNVLIDIGKLYAKIDALTSEDLLGPTIIGYIPGASAEMHKQKEAEQKRNLKNQTDVAKLNLKSKAMQLMISTWDINTHHPKDSLLEFESLTHLDKIEKLPISPPSIKINCNNCESILPVHHPYFIDKEGYQNSTTFERDFN